jgi:hypothetical protein
MTKELSREMSNQISFEEALRRAKENFKEDKTLLDIETGQELLVIDILKCYDRYLKKEMKDAK